jgi:hypothetical protein
MSENLVKTEEKELVTYGLSDELQARIEMAKEAMESFEDAKMPPIRFQDGAFCLEESGEAQETIKGVIIFTHKSNIFFEKQWRPGQPVEPPRCFSPDGKMPNVENPIHPNCRDCPKNRFGSSVTGDGKACRNVRPVFVLLEGSIMPRQLRVPPTSLKMVESYCLGTVADIGSYWCLETEITGFKKSESQTHWNMRFARGPKLTPERFAEVGALRALWMPTMRASQLTQEDLYEAETTMDPAHASGPVHDVSGDEVKF